MASFGDRLKKLRTAQSLSLRDVEARSGVPSQVLHRLEHKTDLGNVQAMTLKKLAQVYGVTVDYLVGPAEPLAEPPPRRKRRPTADEEEHAA